MRPYMWCLLGTKAQPHFLIQNRFFSERDSSRPTQRSPIQIQPQAGCGLASDPPTRKKIAPRRTGFEMTASTKTAHTEQELFPPRQGTTHAHLPAIATAIHPLSAALGCQHSGDQQLPSRIPVGPKLQQRAARWLAGGAQDHPLLYGYQTPSTIWPTRSPRWAPRWSFLA